MYYQVPCIWCTQEDFVHNGHFRRPLLASSAHTGKAVQGMTNNLMESAHAECVPETKATCQITVQEPSSVSCSKASAANFGVREPTFQERPSH